MTISKYYRQLNPVVTEKVNHVERMRAHLREVYLTEAKSTASTLLEELSPGAELQRAIELAELIDTKVASVDAQTTLKEDNKNRITLIQVVNDKDRIKFAALAKEVIDTEENFSNINISSSRSEKDYHFRHVDVDRSIYIQLKPSGAKGQVRNDPNELLAGIFSCINYKNPTNIEELDALIDLAKNNIGKSQGHTQGQIDLFDKAYTNACQAISAANAMKKMLGGTADKVFMTGVKWPAEVEKFKRDSYGMKDFNSSDIILKKGNTYFGVSLKKKQSKTAEDPTILNKAFDTILNGPDLVSVKTKLAKKKEEFYIKVIKQAMKENILDKKPVNAKNWKTFLGGGKSGTKTKLGNDYVNKSLKSTSSLFKDMSDIIKSNEKLIAESLINLVLKMDLKDLKENNFMFSLITGNGRYGPNIGAVIEDADVYEIDTIVEKMDRLGWSDRNLSIEFNNKKVQAFDVGATAAKLFYVVKVGKLDIIKIELRYKGSFTAQPQFFAVFTNKFKEMLK
jgi:hypothetical protein